MQEKNYTNPEDRGRFGFSMSGEYRAPYKAEAVMVALLIVLAAAAGGAMVFILVHLNELGKREMTTANSSLLITISCVIVLIVFVAIIIGVFGIGIRSVKKGFLCQYNANEETFSATVGGDLHVIQYKDVSNVHFQPRSFLGKIRGYDVTIKVNGKEELFSICSDGYLSPKATPFYIIQERVEILRHPHIDNTGYINTSQGNTKAITRAERERATTGSISAMDRMAMLLGETSNMPELSADASPSSQAAARVTQMINEYSSSDMPAVGEKATRTSEHTYIGSDGREHLETEIQAQGTFYVKPDKYFTILVTVFGSLGVGGLFLLLWKFFGMYIKGLNSILSSIIVVIMTIAVCIIAAYFFLTKLHSPLYSYRADGRGFYVTKKGKGEELILYKDVLSIDYTPTKLLWGNYGYKVDILTTYGLIHYDYIFPRFNQKIPRQYLPFEPIRKNMPSSNQNNQSQQ